MKKLILIFFLLSIAALGCTTQQSQTTTTAGSTNIIRLYYTYPSVAAKDKDYSSQNFGSAYSNDGITFTQESDARLGPLAYLTDPDVFKEGSNKWVMFYSKAISPNTSESVTLFKATSTTPNGTFSADNAFIDNYGNISSTIKIGDVFYVYGVSTEGIAISTYDPNSNSLTYLKTATMGNVADPSVIQISSNNFKLYYKSSGNTYCMSSTDGLTWTNDTLIVSKAEVPGAIYLNNKIYLYYIDGDTTSATSGKVLLKTSIDSGVSFSDPQVITGLPEGAADPNPVAYE